MSDRPMPMTYSIKAAKFPDWFNDRSLLPRVPVDRLVAEYRAKMGLEPLEPKGRGRR